MSLNIIIDEDYKIISDPHCIHLQKRKMITNKETGEKEIGWGSFGYYPDVVTTIKGLLRRKVKLSNAESIQELINEIKKYEQKIDRVLRCNKIQI